MRLGLLLAVFMLAFAGCVKDDPPTPDPQPTCTPQPFQEPAVVGQAGEAMAWVEAIVYQEPGVLRPRVPEDPGHSCTAAWLAEALDVEGWSVGWSNFTGADYQAIADKGAAGGWINSCPANDKAAVANLTLHNLWARREGGDRLVILAAHWDAKEDASDGGPVPAANDGASGMGVLLALQRAMTAQDIQLPFDVAVIFFDAEDGFNDCHPLAGSLHFSRTKTLDVDRMILLDMVGDRSARFPREANSVQADPGLVDLVWRKAAVHGLGENFVDDVVGVTDDHIPFIEDGVPAIDIIHLANGFPPYWHTSEDTPDKLDAAMLDSMTALMLDVLQDPDFVGTWA